MSLFQNRGFYGCPSSSSETATRASPLAPSDGSSRGCSGKASSEDPLRPASQVHAPLYETCKKVLVPGLQGHQGSRGSANRPNEDNRKWPQALPVPCMGQTNQIRPCQRLLQCRQLHGKATLPRAHRKLTSKSNPSRSKAVSSSWASSSRPAPSSTSNFFSPCLRAQNTMALSGAPNASSNRISIIATTSLSISSLTPA